MTKTTVDYNTNNSVIYIMRCKDGNCLFTYTGSTANFTQRKASHKTSCNSVNSKKYNYLLYQTIRANGGWDNWTMAIIEIFPCESKQHLCVREQFYIEQQENKVNSNRAFATNEDRLNNAKEYYQTNREEIIDYKQKYYEKNLEIYKTRNTAYREANNDIIKEKRELNKADKKEYDRMKRHNSWKYISKVFRKILISELQQ